MLKKKEKKKNNRSKNQENPVNEQIPEGTE